MPNDSAQFSPGKNRHCSSGASVLTTTKMRHFDLFVSIIGGMAAALLSMDANASEPFVDVRSVDPTITVELRYAGRNNFLGYSLYPDSRRHAVCKALPNMEN
jgi:D-alanyl-D-alanine dipeptidase